MIKYKNTEKLMFIIFILSVFTFYCVWANILPFDAAPDERMRYQIAQFIFKNNFLPHGGDPSIRDYNWGISYAFTPILSYIISAIFMKITSIFTINEDVLLFSARLVTVLFNTATVAVSIKICEFIFKNVYIKWLFLILISMLPQFVFLSCYVNVDALAMFSTAVIIYAWIAGIKTDWSIKNCVILSLGISLCLLSYYNAYGFILCSVILFFATIFTINKLNNNVKKILSKTLLIILIVFLLTGWWFIRNAILYNGDFLGFNTSNTYGEMYGQNGFKPSQLNSPLNNGRSLWFMLYSQLWAPYAVLSFIGYFGYRSIKLDVWMYVFYILIIIIGIIGCLINLRRFFPKKSEQNHKKDIIFNTTMLISIVIPIIINIYYSYTTDFQPQGRYSMPSLIPLMYFITSGIDTIINKFKNKSVKKIIPIIICGICILIAILCLTNIIIPIYE